MRILVTGARGQLGQDVISLFSQFHEVYGVGRSEMDVTDLEKIREIVVRIQPDIIIHTAAYTAVDRAEEEVEKAYAVNALGSRNIALAAKAVGAKLCAISTDYVFDGAASIAYHEDAKTNPKSVYGASKLAGEDYIRDLVREHFIVRTAWVFGQHGNNFVKTMLRMGAQGKPLTVVDDQIGSPTYTLDLAEFLLTLVQTEEYGTYHAVNSGSCSWYQFACAIFEEKGMGVEITACATEDFPRLAPRPAYSVLQCKAMERHDFQLLRPWREALKEFILNIN